MYFDGEGVEPDGSTIQTSKGFMSIALLRECLKSHEIANLRTIRRIIAM
jgi:hypothetical protein